MSNVVKLVRPSNDETVAVLKGLLNKALAGGITGLALCYCGPDGADGVAFTDAFAGNSDKAISAAVRLSLRLTQVYDERRRSP